MPERPVLLPQPRTVEFLGGTCAFAAFTAPQPRLEAAWPAPPHDDGYILEIRPDGAHVAARAKAGLFYALQTLRQLRRIYDAVKTAPCLRITDWPDFPQRGVMLDISRDKVPALATLYALVDKLAEWKINQFQLYTEHTFAY